MSKINTVSNFNPPLQIADMRVVAFMSDGYAKILQSWKDRKLGSRVMAAESCARNIWMGPKCEFNDFPIKSDKIIYYHGIDAYKFMLSFILGYENSSGNYDPASYNRFMNSWSKISKRSPTSSKIYSTLLSGMVTDHALIKKSTSSLIKSDRDWVIARELSELKKGNNVLLIGDRGVTKEISDLTLKMAVTLHGRGEYSPESVGYLHSSKQHYAAAARNLNSLRIKHDLPYSFYSSPSEEMALAFEMHDAVFITTEMGKHPELEQKIADLWRKRTRSDNVMVHLNKPKREVRDNYDMSLWDQLKKQSPRTFFSYDEISDIKEKRQSTFLATSKKIPNAIEILANLRLHRQSPSLKLLESIFQNRQCTSSLTVT